MLNKILTGVLLIVMATLPNLAMGQGMAGGKWWLNPQISEKLKLTDEEKSKLDEQFVESRRKLIDLKRDVEKERFELETLLERQQLDEDAVKKQHKRLEKTRINLSDERFKLIMQSRKILGNERFQELKAHMKMHRHKKYHGKGRTSQ